MNISFESHLEEGDFIGDVIATPLHLPPPLPFDDYESMLHEYNIEHSYDITTIEKTSKFLRRLTLTPFILKKVEALVVKSTPTLCGYSKTQHFFLGASSLNTTFDLTFKDDFLLN